MKLHLSPLLALCACSALTPVDRVEPTFIEVVLQGETGSPDAPLPFSAEATSWTATVRTLGRDRELHPFEGDLQVSVRPGRLNQSPYIPITGGEWTGEISIEAGFGPTRLWFSDLGDKDIDTGRQASFATGVSEPIHYAFPTIAEMQRIDDPEKNQLYGEFGELRVEDRQVVVSAVTTNGFWVTDLADGPAAYGSLFIYSFSKPAGVEEGLRITQLTGGVQEYLATTQLNFPTYELEDAGLSAPEPVALDPFALCSGERVEATLAEAYESSVVYVENGTVPASVGPDGEDYADYLEYGQWPIEVGGCIFYVESQGLDFHPPDHVGATVTLARGVLVEVWDQWVISVRGAEDLVVPGATSRPRGTPGPRRPLPRSERP